MVLNAVVRVRGSVKLRHDVEMALDMLNLRRVNWATIVRDDAPSKGQLEKVKNMAAFGQVNSRVLGLVLEKRGRLLGDKVLTKEFLASKSFKSFEELAQALIDGKTSLKELGLKPFFRLHPPKKGHERAGIKKPFSLGGALGNRGEAINGLLTSMA